MFFPRTPKEGLPLSIVSHSTLEIESNRAILNSNHLSQLRISGILPQEVEGEKKTPHTVIPQMHCCYGREGDAC